MSTTTNTQVPTNATNGYLLDALPRELRGELLLRFRPAEALRISEEWPAQFAIIIDCITYWEKKIEELGKNLLLEEFMFLMYVYRSPKRCYEILLKRGDCRFYRVSKEEREKVIGSTIMFHRAALAGEVSVDERGSFFVACNHYRSGDSDDLWSAAKGAYEARNEKLFFELVRALQRAGEGFLFKTEQVCAWTWKTLRSSAS